MFVIFVNCLLNLFCISNNSCVVTVSFIFEEVFEERVRSENVWATCLENTGDGCVNVLGLSFL